MIRILESDIHIANTRARMPFRYGIASMTVMPQVFVRVHLTVDGRKSWGIAADCLPPKWCTKDPASDYRDDVADMLSVIRAASTHLQQAGEGESVFDLWQQTYIAQMGWGTKANHRPLLWNFGVTLVERAMIDAFCRATDTTFARALHDNALGMHLRELHHELADARPADLLPGKPLDRIIARHTVGLSDPLTDDDIASEARVDDGLPQALDACIGAYGLTHFKIKIGGDAEGDLERLRRIAHVLDTCIPGGNYAYTLDGNEQYRSVGDFAAFWQSLAGCDALSAFRKRLLFVEQPLHRDVALSAATGDDMLDWDDRPATIIDESDCMITSLPEALDLGYVGTSYKSCKGVFKGIANACLIAQRRRQNPNGRYIISGEDLCNIGPVALLQDLAVVASLGITHVERNGHHYFKGLAMFPNAVQQQVLDHHGDLYHRHAQGFVALNVQDGGVAVGSVTGAPLGVAFNLDVSLFTPVDDWKFDSLNA